MCLRVAYVESYIEYTWFYIGNTQTHGVYIYIYMYVYTMCLRVAYIESYIPRP